MADDEAVISITVFAPSAFCQVALSDPRKISPRLCPQSHFRSYWLTAKNKPEPAPRGWREEGRAQVRRIRYGGLQKTRIYRG